MHADELLELYAYACSLYNNPNGNKTVVILRSLSITTYTSKAGKNRRRYDTFALIDKGADISVANPSLISKLRNIGVRVKIDRSDKESILIANNEKVKIIGVISVYIVVGKENVHVRFYLVPGLEPYFRRQLVAQTDVTLPPRSEKLIVAKIKGTPLPDFILGKFVCLSDKDKVFVVNESKTSASVQNTPTEDEGAVMNEILSHIGRDLNDKERDQLVNVLENYSNVFVNGGKLGNCDILQHEISMPCDQKPIRQRPYKIGNQQKQILENMIDDMLKQDIIEPSTSPWAAPCLLVAKKNNSKYRFVVDYRKIKSITEQDAHLLLTTDDALESLGATQPSYFSCLDLRSGAVLYQEQSGQERVICYAVRALSKQEQNYGITELESLALVFAIQKFDCYLRFTSFTTYVDHAALKWLLSLKEPRGKFARWDDDLDNESLLNILPSYQIHETQQLNTKESSNPIFSPPVRKIACQSMKQCRDSHANVDNLFSTTEIKSEQRADNNYKDIIDYLETGRLPKDKDKHRKVLVLQPFYF
ncbi:unnamed protein product [Mytilus coruscus]|uniref:Reverse transcriptase RNase H-like domain-containing protein n=1 Tax=Mytilus coruscus TaxID=42192 RepID=A0A6J8ADS6_MYTCO|nr:unnamed protein product [Mytilus coruscus]